MTETVYGTDDFCTVVGDEYRHNNRKSLSHAIVKQYKKVTYRRQTALRHSCHKMFGT